MTTMAYLTVAAISLSFVCDANTVTEEKMYTYSKRRRPCYKTEMNLLLVGATGAGKSSTGNSILGKNVFETASNSAPKTKQLQIASAENDGYKFTVVDTPSVNGAALEQNSLEEILFNNFSTSFKYHDAILYVMPLGVIFKEEDENTIEILRWTFGDIVIREKLILVVTHYMEWLYPTEIEISFMSRWQSWFTLTCNLLLKDCGRRIILFDNEAKDKETMKEQVRRLTKLVDGIRKTYSKYNLRWVLEEAVTNICNEFKNISADEPRRLCLLEGLKNRLLTEIEFLLSKISRKPSLVQLLRESFQLFGEISHAILETNFTKKKEPEPEPEPESGFMDRIVEFKNTIWSFFGYPSKPKEEIEEK